MDGQSEEFLLLLVFNVFNVAVSMPECAFQTQMHAFPFSVPRALELLGFRANISSYVEDIAQQFSRVPHQSTLPPAGQPSHSTPLSTVTRIFNVTHCDGCVTVLH